MISCANKILSRSNNILSRRNKLKNKTRMSLPGFRSLDIIIKLKFTTYFDRCAILNVLNCLTKNFES